MIFINGEATKIPLDELIAKGRELIASGYPQTTQSFNRDMNEACTAVHWYDEQHQLYVEETHATARAEAREGAG
jgi:hypothetical protein